MVFTKKMFLAILLAFTLGATSTVTSAAGKIKNATMEEVTSAVEDTVKGVDDILAALNNGADKETIMTLFKETKQRAKAIEVSRLGMLKGKASTQMRKSKSAFKKDDLENAKKHAAKSSELYHELRTQFYSF